MQVKCAYTKSVRWVVGDNLQDVDPIEGITRSRIVKSLAFNSENYLVITFDDNSVRLYPPHAIDYYELEK